MILACLNKNYLKTVISYIIKIIMKQKKLHFLVELFNEFYLNNSMKYSFNYLTYQIIKSTIQ
jgi:type IV secretory pathway TrbL component